MAGPVTDPELLAQLNGPEPKAGSKQVTDPALLAVLEGNAHPLVAAHVDMSAEPKGILQTIREAVHAPTRTIGNAYLMGLGDRAEAVMDTAIKPGSIGDYGANLKQTQAKSDQFAKDHPIASPVLNVVGGVAAPAAAIGAAAKGVTLGTKTLISAGTGAGIGGVQGALGSRDWTDILQTAKDAGVSAVVGGTLGGVMPSVARGVGALYEKAANLFSGRVEGMSRDAGGHLIKAVEADGPAAVQQRLQELGPDAMLADAGPSLFARTQGAIGNSLEGRTVATRALDARDSATQARIRSDLDKAVGPYQGGDPQTITNDIIAHRTAVDNVNYPAAFQGAPNVQTAHILTQLDDMIPRSIGMERKALTTLRDHMMTTEQRPRMDAFGRQEVNARTGQPIFDEFPISQNDAEILHKVKGQLDNVIEYDAPGLGVPAGAVKNQQAALKQMRFQVNDALEQQVPGYANANAVSRALAQRAEAVKAGTQYLGSGKTTPSPERFAAAFDPLEHGTKIALAKGSRGELERVVGVHGNDLVALKGALQGEGGWNTAKLATVHGQDATDELVGTVDRNQAFRNTRNEAIKGAQTDLRNAARKEMKPDPSTETPIFGPASSPTGIATTLLKKGGQKVFNALMQSDPTRSFGEVARALTEQGSARDQRLISIVNALNSRQGNAAAGETAGKLGAVVAALLGKGTADELRASPNRKRLQ